MFRQQHGRLTHFINPPDNRLGRYLPAMFGGKKAKRTRARECGWNNNGDASERAIPFYDAVDDKYCTITRKPQFQKHLRKTQGGASRDYLRAVQKLRSQHAILNPLIQATGVGAVANALDGGSEFVVFGQDSSSQARAALRCVNESPFHRRRTLERSAEGKGG